jgi:hypothetical protein
VDKVVEKHAGDGPVRGIDGRQFRKDKVAMIGTLFGRKRMTEDKMANIFVNAVLEMVAEGFPTVAAELNEAPEFATCPGLRVEDDRRFALIVLTGNLIEMQRLAGPGIDKRLYSRAISKFAGALDEQASLVEEEVRALRDRMERINYPSKNTVYAMAKALFHEYELFRFQDPYFREQRAPNPIVLKRVKALMGYFVWGWNDVFEQYRVV